MSVKLHAKSTEETFRTLCHLMDNNKKVYYARFGDGDIFIMMGKSQQNHNYHPELGKEMDEAFCVDNPLYLKGLTLNYPLEKGMFRGFFGHYKNNDEMNDFLVNKFNITEDKTYESQWFMQYYSIYKPKEMVNFLNKYIRPKKKMFIGGVPQEDIEQLVGKIDYYIKTPHKNSYWEIDEWWSKVIEHIDNVELVLPASGMSTRIINKRLWKLNKEVYSIDLGSIVDAVGNPKKTRRWIRTRSHIMNKILLPEHQKKGVLFKTGYLIKEFRFLISKWHFLLKHRY
ncbi:hypothetical protein ACFLTE_07640 [Bacteroidota bacterium]